MIYRPHPRTGRASDEHARADKIIRSRLASAGDRHLVDEGEYGWQWAFADACVTDISAVAYDWLATGKPLVITEPENRAAYRPPSPLLDGVPLLHADEAGLECSIEARCGRRRIRSWPNWRTTTSVTWPTGQQPPVCGRDRCGAGGRRAAVNSATSRARSPRRRPER